MGKTGGEVVCLFCSCGCTRRNLCFTLKIVNTLIKNSSRDDRPSISTYNQATANPLRVGPASCRARPKNVDDGIEDIMWLRGVGGERLPAASYALLPNPKKGLFFAIGKGSRIFVVCFLHTRGQMFLNHTPGRRPPRITGRVVKSV